MKRYILKIAAAFFAVFLVWQIIFFVDSSNVKIFCCANENVIDADKIPVDGSLDNYNSNDDNSNDSNSNIGNLEFANLDYDKLEFEFSIADLIETGKFKDAYNILRNLILEPQQQENLNYLKKHKTKIENEINKLATVFHKLPPDDNIEIDDLLEKAQIIHKNNWRALEQIALTYVNIKHNGQIINNKFIRNPNYNNREIIYTIERDHTQALIILTQAMKLAIIDDNKEDVAKFFINLADVIYIKSRFQPLILTNLSILPDYSDNYGFNYDYNFAPVNPNGTPIFYSKPKSFQSAKNDTERRLWALDQAAKFCPHKYAAVTLQKQADFSISLFGANTLSESYSYNYSYKNRVKKDIILKSLKSLADNETIAQSADGIKKFKLPDKHNFIKIYRKLYNTTSGKQKFEAGMSLAGAYNDRKQYDRTANLLKKLIDEFDNDKFKNDKFINLEECKKQLDQIVKNWGQFVEGYTVINGLNADLKYKFRNGKKVNVTVYKIDMQKFIDDLKLYYDNPAPYDSNKQFQSVIRIINRSITDDKDTYSDQNLTPQQIREKYNIKKIKQWTQNLTPPKNHGNGETIIKFSAPETGIYFIKTTIENGNTDAKTVWINNTVIIERLTNDNIIYMLVDKETGKPIPNAEINLFCKYYAYQSNKTHTQIKKISNKRKNGKTNIDGLVQLEKKDLLSIDDSLVIASTDDGRIAISTIGRVISSYEDEADDNIPSKVIVTDRPVYRPNDDVKFKVWISNRKNNYDQRNQNKWNGKLVACKIANPKGVKIWYKKDIKLDAYGSLTDTFHLPKDATLGKYSITIYADIAEYASGYEHFNYYDNDEDDETGVVEDNYRSSLGDRYYFQVEEYRNPEYEVTIETPKTQVKLGNKFDVTIRAKYFFGSPVANATVKYDVVRTTNTYFCQPSRDWDWLYGEGYSLDENNYQTYLTSRKFKRKQNWNWQFDIDTWRPEKIVSKKTKIGADGTITFEIDTANAKKNFPFSNHDYIITAEVTDDSRRTIISTDCVVAVANPFEIYAYTDKRYYVQNQEITANFKTQQINGQPIKGKGKANLYKLSYKKQKKTNVNDNDNDYETSETKIFTKDVTFNNDGLAELKFNVAEAGQYIISCEIEEQESDYMFNVYPKSNELQDAENSNVNESWRFNELELIPDKLEYAAGDNLNLRINTEKENAFVYVLFHTAAKTTKKIKAIQLKGKSALVSIPVETCDSPNFYIEAFTVIDGQINYKDKEIVVPPQEKILNVNIQPDAANYKPGDKVKMKLTVTDLNGKPVVGQLTAAVYDKSIEYITDDLIGGNGEIRDFIRRMKRFFHLDWQSNIDYQIQRNLNHQRYFMVDLSQFSDHIREARYKKIIVNPNGYIDQLIGGRQFYGGYGGYGGGATHSKIPTPVLAPPVDLANARDSRSNTPIVNKQFIDPKVRSNFSDTAYWNGVIETDSDGVAEVEFAMPESLTTWKINVWSIAHGTRVGYGTTQIITRKDLIIRMQSPRFLIEKDQIVLGAIV
ncbi:MAG: hypothetical protein LBP59_01165, partial [Planctomycetaceae bacterium]|nr:hypothetical protein [Planctomycetaceae bacterium]